MINRREVLSGLAALSLAATGGCKVPGKKYHAARFWHPMGNTVACDLCPRGCILKEGKTGDCRTRSNIGGSLYALGYSNPCAVHVDPIEKKPLYHFLPGIPTFSLAIAGCNLRCKNCQNYSISQKSPLETENVFLSPQKVVEEAKRLGCKAIAYTYSEPVVWIEYLLDTAVLARKAGLKNVLVSAGYINPAPFREMTESIDAAHIDLKSFDEKIYEDLNEGKLSHVLETLRIARQKGVWIEIVNLVIPQLTDNIEMIRNMSRWIVQNLGADTPVHFSRFFPLYKLAHLFPTPEDVLNEARKAAMDENIRYAYIGNVPRSETHTYCHKCRELLIDRDGYIVRNHNLKNGMCGKCGTMIPGVWHA